MKNKLNMIRNILLSIASSQQKQAIKPLIEVSKLEIIPLTKLLDYMQKDLHLIETKEVYTENINDGTAKLTYRGEQVAEMMRNDERWKELLDCCDKIDCYAFDVVMNILQTIIGKDISNPKKRIANLYIITDNLQ